MQPLTPQFAKTDLTPHTEAITIDGHRYRAEVTGAEACVHEEGPDGEKRYAVKHAMGGKNVYYFLTPLERGRLQVLPLAYSVREKKWYNATASMVRHITGDSAVDWRDPLLTFNTSCYGCHVSQLSTNYDTRTDTYHTVWSEPGINCETCHGAGAEHIRVCKATPEGRAPKDLKILRYEDFTIEQTNATCAGCHAKATPISPAFKPGGKVFDHYDLVTYESPDYYPDGRDLGENYTLTSWLRSPCVKSGTLSCTHCHTSSGRYRFQGDKANNACLPCHQKRVGDPQPHTRHKPGTAGSRCVDCHMPKTTFAHMDRSDHSMLPPTPAATIAMQSPNACNLCHTKKEEDAAWADKLVRRWHERDYQAPFLAIAGLLHAARETDWTGLDVMLAYVASEERDAIVATSLIRLLAQCRDARKWPVLIRALGDPSPLVRGAAADALTGCFAPEALPALLKALGDPYRLVRIRAASALAAYPRDRLGAEDRQRLAAASVEFEVSLGSRLDQWVSHYNLGNYYASRGWPKKALTSFETAHRLRADTVLPLVNASMAHAQLGQDRQAEEKLRKALKIEPNSAAVNFNLGLLLAGKGQKDEAERAFRTALKADPTLARGAYNLGVLIADDRPAEAIRWCRKAADLRPDVPKYAYTLAFYLVRSQDADGAIPVLEALVKAHPAFPDSYLLLGRLYEQASKLEDAKALYSRTAANGRLPPQLRAIAQGRLRAIKGR